MYSQDKGCTISDIQLEIYDFTSSNLNEISKNINDRNSLIEVNIAIKNKNIQTIKYYLISPENNYTEKSESEIKIWKKLNSFITKTISDKIQKCPNLDYEGIKFRVPISEENIQKAITEVNSLKYILEQK